MARRSRTNGRGLAAIPSDALTAELRRRQQRVQGLVRRHARLISAARRLEAQIREMGGGVPTAAGNGVLAAPAGRRGRPPAGRKRGAKPGVKRPRNEMNLVEAMAALLKGRTMNVTKIAEEVQKAGYKTTSPNFRTIVNQTLIKSNRFKKVARGQYTAK
jgi:hypothetical protein